MENAASDFFGGLRKGLTENINVAIVGRIEKFEAKTMKADVAPLYPGYPLLIELPVLSFNGGGFAIRPIYKRGDLVLVVFTDKDMDNLIMDGKLQNLNSTRAHALEDGVVVGGLNAFSKPLDVSGASDSLVISGHGAKVELKTNGQIELEGKKVRIKGDLEVDTINGQPYPPIGD